MKKKNTSAVSRLLRALAWAKVGRRDHGSRVTGTLFRQRPGHMRFAFQSDPRTCPAAVIEFATPTCRLAREMAKGNVRIELECERSGSEQPLVEEPVWRATCNGRKCGFAYRRECGPADWRVLRAVSMGAGVLPGMAEDERGVTYMRSRFHRVVESKDSKEFIMMNPQDENGEPEELGILLRRV